MEHVESWWEALNGRWREELATEIQAGAKSILEIRERWWNCIWLDTCYAHYFRSPLPPPQKKWWSKKVQSSAHHFAHGDNDKLYHAWGGQQPPFGWASVSTAWFFFDTGLVELKGASCFLGASCVDGDREYIFLAFTVASESLDSWGGSHWDLSTVSFNTSDFTGKKISKWFRNVTAR